MSISYCQAYTPLCGEYLGSIIWLFLRLSHFSQQALFSMSFFGFMHQRCVVGDDRREEDRVGPLAHAGPIRRVAESPEA